MAITVEFSDLETIDALARAGPVPSSPAEMDANRISPQQGSRGGFLVKKGRRIDAKALRFRGGMLREGSVRLCRQR